MHNPEQTPPRHPELPETPGIVHGHDAGFEGAFMPPREGDKAPKPDPRLFDVL